MTHSEWLSCLFGPSKVLVCEIKIFSVYVCVCVKD